MLVRPRISLTDGLFCVFYRLTPIAGLLALTILSQLPETLPKHLRRKMDWAACNPLRFLKLFRNRTMTLLTLARGLQDAPEFISIYDINFVFLNSAVGWAPLVHSKILQVLVICRFL